MKINSKKSNSRQERLSGLFLICITLFAPLLIIINGADDPNLMPRFIIFSIISLVFLVLLVINIRKGKNIYDLSILKRAIFPIYLAYLFIAAISIFAAVNISEAIWEWLKIFVFFIYLVMLSLFLANVSRVASLLTKIVTLFSFLILLIGGYGLFKRAWRYVCLFTGSLVLVYITVLMTRSVWFALIIALLASIPVLILFSRELLISKKTIKFLVLCSLISILIITGSVVIYSKFNSVDIFTYRIKEIGNFKEGSASKRLML